MQFIPREIQDNVNISSQSPLKEFFILLSAFLCSIIVIYVLLGFAVELIVPNLPVKVEQRLGAMYSRQYAGEKDEVSAVKEAELQRILEGLLQEAEFNQSFQAYLVSDSRANAFALPGGNILVTSALLKEVETENELAFILAHELGHFANRDHLRALGRRLVLFTFAVVLFGPDSSLSQISANALQNTEMKFSQKQEKGADLFALGLLNARYGHVAGATDFFKKSKKKQAQGRFLYFFATHPHSLDRTAALEREITVRGYLVKEAIPLEGFLKE